MDAVEVARHFEQVLADNAVAIAPLSQQIGTAIASYSEPGSWLNQCWNFGMQGPVTSADVDEIVSFYDFHQVEARIGLPTVADPSAAKALAGRGFNLGEFINMLALDLTPDATTIQPLHPAPPELRIHQVDKKDDDAIRSWAELSTRGFNDGDPAPSAEGSTAAKLLRYEGVDGFVATMDDVPAAAGAMAVNDAHGHRSASLFATGVLPEFRRVGIQQHLIATRLNRARELGATVATIGSLPGISGERNAARFGFHLSYVKVMFVRPL